MHETWFKLSMTALYASSASDLLETRRFTHSPFWPVIAAQLKIGLADQRSSSNYGPLGALAMINEAVYSLVIAIHQAEPCAPEDWRLGDITVDWVDFTREKSLDKSAPPPPSSAFMTTTTRKASSSFNTVPGSGSHSQLYSANGLSRPVTKASGSRKRQSTPTSSAAHKGLTDPDALSLQPLVAHFPSPNPLDTSVDSGSHTVGRGVVHLFRHAPAPSVIASIDAHPVGESSSAGLEQGEWAGERAEGEDGSLVAILAVPAWMRPADFLEFIGGWATCLEGVRMIRYVARPDGDCKILMLRNCVGRRRHQIDRSCFSNSVTPSKLPIFWSYSPADHSPHSTLAKPAIPSVFTTSSCTTLTLPHLLNPLQSQRSHLRPTLHERSTYASFSRA